MYMYIVGAFSFLVLAAAGCAGPNDACKRLWTYSCMSYVTRTPAGRQGGRGAFVVSLRSPHLLAVVPLPRRCLFFALPIPIARLACRDGRHGKNKHQMNDIKGKTWNNIDYFALSHTTQLNSVSVSLRLGLLILLLLLLVRLLLLGALL